MRSLSLDVYNIDCFLFVLNMQIELLFYLSGQ